MLETTPSRLAAFACALALTGGAAAAVGASTDLRPPLQDCMKIAAAEAGEPESMADEGMAEDMVEALPGADGRRSTLAGVSLRAEPQALEAGTTTRWRFRVVDCDGRAVRDFEPENGKLLHLIVVRSDTTGYQHLHPTLGPDGTFSVDVATPRGGRYRALADFVIDGRKHVLGTTLRARGAGVDRPLPPPSLRARSGAYEVELQRPAVLEAGHEAQLTFRVTRDGRPVRDLEPYLGAYGHLVALHTPDLAYSHVHPAGEDTATGAITFDAELEAPGDHRLFLQLRIDGRVHTVAFTQTVS